MLAGVSWQADVGVADLSRFVRDNPAAGRRQQHSLKPHRHRFIAFGQGVEWICSPPDRYSGSLV